MAHADHGELTWLTETTERRCGSWRPRRANVAPLSGRRSWAGRRAQFGCPSPPPAGCTPKPLAERNFVATLTVPAPGSLGRSPDTHVAPPVASLLRCHPAGLTPIGPALPSSAPALGLGLAIPFLLPVFLFPLHSCCSFQHSICLLGICYCPASFTAIGSTRTGALVDFIH